MHALQQELDAGEAEAINRFLRAGVGRLSVAKKGQAAAHPGHPLFLLSCQPCGAARGGVVCGGKEGGACGVKIEVIGYLVNEAMFDSPNSVKVSSIWSINFLASLY